MKRVCTVGNLNNCKSCFTMPLCLLLLLTCRAFATQYVVPGGAGDLSGASWANAHASIQAAIDAAELPGEEVWVAAGRYLLDETLLLRSGSRLLGGFQGDESDSLQRDWHNNVTVLDGQQSCRIADLSGLSEVRLDGLLFTRGYVLTDDEIGGAAILMVETEASTIANCRFILNYAQRIGTQKASGGAIYMHSTTDCTISDSSFSNNRLDPNQSGISMNAIDADRLVIERCKFVGEYQFASNFGVLSINKRNAKQGAKIINCLFSGNRAYYGSLGYLIYDIAVINCTVACTTNTSPNNAGVIQVPNNPPGNAVYNTILANNTRVAIWEMGTKGKPKVENSLFHGQSDGDYYDFDSGTLLSGAAAINEDVTEPQRTANNIDGDPKFYRFPESDDGNWTAIGTFNPEKVQTTLTDSSARFKPGTLRGLCINPNTTYSLHRHAIIADNSETTITIWGDASWVATGSSWTTVGSPYRIYDYRLRTGSPAINAGNVALAPSEDLCGKPRRYRSEVDIGAFAWQPPPGSALLIR